MSVNECPICSHDPCDCPRTPPKKGGRPKRAPAKVTRWTDHLGALAAVDAAIAASFTSRDVQTLTVPTRRRADTFRRAIRSRGGRLAADLYTGSHWWIRLMVTT